MDTEKKLGIKKPQAIMLFLQMIFTLILLAGSIYLLVFAISNNLGWWMISSYILIIISALAIVLYACIGFKKGDIAYILAVVPFLGAILVNVILPNRSAFQIALLAILLSLNFAFLLRQKDDKFTYIIALSMIVVSLTFSIYSSVTARIDFLGDISKNWPTYFAMYLSIFIPVIMSITFTVTYNVRMTRTIEF